MTKEQLIKIAEVSFPERVKKSINFSNLEMNHFSGIYRLYDKDTPFVTMLPKESLFSISFGNGEEKFVQIQVKYLAFNHYAAIKELERMGLV